MGAHLTPTHQQHLTPDAMEQAKDFIAKNTVMIFSKSYCPYCTKVKQLFQGLGVNFTAVELDRIADGSEIQAALKQITGGTTVPRVFINSEHIGGNDDTQVPPLAPRAPNQEHCAQPLTAPSPFLL